MKVEIEVDETTLMDLQSTLRKASLVIGEPMEEAPYQRSLRLSMLSVYNQIKDLRYARD